MIQHQVGDVKSSLVAHLLFISKFKQSNAYCELASILLSETWTSEGEFYLFAHNSLIIKILPQASNDIELLLDRQACDCCLDDGAHAGSIDSDEALIVHICEYSHNKLTVHAVRNTAMSRNTVAEILNLEGALEAGSEESTEGCD